MDGIGDPQIPRNRGMDGNGAQIPRKRGMDVAGAPLIPRNGRMEPPKFPRREGWMGLKPSLPRKRGMSWPSQGSTNHPPSRALAGADSLGLNKSSFSLPFPLREAGATSEMLLSH